MPIFDSSEGSKAPKHTMHEAAQGVRLNPGPFIAQVKNNVDPMRSGRLQVWISELGGDPEDPASWRTVTYASPFFGVTPPPHNPDGVDKRSNSQAFGNNPHSYGFWMVPPDIGVKVICIFINGDPFKGYWFACVPDWPNMHMVPAIGRSTKSPSPVVDYNDDQSDASQITQFFDRQSTKHDVVAQQLQTQGLSQDMQRGAISSTAFRESPSAVFGFSTPGRALKAPSMTPEGTEAAIDTNVMGRKGGHSFVMDDGEDTGDNQLIRLRSATGHQLTMHDAGGFIYVTNAAGTAWFEMDKVGNINMYANGQFNIKSKGPLQLQSDAGVKISGKSGVDIQTDGMANMSGKGAVNISSDAETKVTGKKILHLKGGKALMTGDQCVGIKGGAHTDIMGGCINMNGGAVTPAQAAGPASPPQGMPTKEPWSGHLRGGSSGTSKGSTSTIAGATAAGIASGFGKTGGYNGNTGGTTGATTPIATSGSSNSGNTSATPTYVPSSQGNTLTTSGGSYNVQPGSYTTISAPAGGGSMLNPSQVSGYVAYPDLLGKSVGSGQCVALVQATAGLPATGAWRPASDQSVFNNPPPPGTCIATFGNNGVYQNQPGQSHAAIYLDQGVDANGRKYILVQDQWAGQGTTVRRLYEGGGYGKPPGAENPENMRVIATKDNPNGVQVKGAPPVPQKDTKDTAIKTNEGEVDPKTGLPVAPNTKDPNNTDPKTDPNSTSRADLNTPDKQGPLTPQQEADNRQQLQQEESKGGDASAGLLPGQSGDLTSLDAVNAKVLQNQSVNADMNKLTRSIDANTAQLNGINQQIAAIDGQKSSLEIAKNNGEISQEQYDQLATKLDTQQAGLTGIRDQYQTRIEGYSAQATQAAALASDAGSGGMYTKPIQDDYAAKQASGIQPIDTSVTRDAASIDTGNTGITGQGFDETTGQPYTFTTSPQTSVNRNIDYTAPSQSSVGGGNEFGNPADASTTQSTGPAPDPGGRDYLPPGSSYGSVSAANTDPQAMINQQLGDNNQSMYGVPTNIVPDTVAGPAPPQTFRQSENASMDNYNASDAGIQGPRAPVTGQTPAPGAGGAGNTGAPQDNKPAAPQGPAC